MKGNSSITQGVWEAFDARQKQRPQKISSHAGWYRGSWEKDLCHCGQAILVPRGKKGVYQCNDCADRAEGWGG
jgi:hypothetical protein